MDIIDKVLSTEQEAARIVEAAKAKADEMRKEADVRLRNDVNLARAHSQDAVKATTEQAHMRAKELVQKAKDEALLEGETYSVGHEGSLTIIAEKAAELIIKPEYER